MERRTDPTIEDPFFPDAQEFQHMALGYVERRIRIFHTVLFGSCLYAASGAALLMRWMLDIDPAGAALMTDLGIIVLIVSLVVAGLGLLRPVKPSVSFVVADQSIRNDNKTSRTFLILAAIYTVLVLILMREQDTARTVSVLVGLWVAVLMGCCALLHARGLRMELHARGLRMDRDELYAARLAKPGVGVPLPSHVVRKVMPGPEIIDSEPSAFELQALAFAKTRARAMAYVLLGPLPVFLFAPLLLTNWILGYEYRIWVIPLCAGLGIMLLCWAIGFLLWNFDRRGKAKNVHWYGWNMLWSTRANRGGSIAGYAGALAIFISGAILTARAIDQTFVVYTSALAVCLASVSPFLLVTGKIMNRRRELFSSQLTKNGEITPECARTHPPDAWVLNGSETQ